MASEHARTTLSMIREFNDHEQYWDVQLLVNGKLYKCQRLILAANSEYFHRMFTGYFRESRVTKDKPIPLENDNGVDLTAFDKFLHYMYTGEVRVDDSNVLQLLCLSDYLALRDGQIKKECIDHVERRSESTICEPITNMWALVDFADRLVEKEALLLVLAVHIRQHVYHYFEEEWLMELNFENFNAIFSLTKKFVLPLPESANAIFMIIYSWVFHNRLERTKHLSQLRENIDLDNHVSTSFAVSSGMDKLASLRELGTLNIPMDLDFRLDGTDARLSETIPLTVKHASRMQMGVVVFSSSFIISNLSWRASFERNGIYAQCELHCNGRGSIPEWNCYASCMFIIKSHKEGKADFRCRLSRRKFSNQEQCYRGYEERLTWNELLYPGRGFLTADGSITIETQVHADVPFVRKF